MPKFTIDMSVASVRVFLRRNAPIIATIGVIATVFGLVWQLRTPQKPSTAPKPENKYTERKEEKPTKGTENITIDTKVHKKSPPALSTQNVIPEKTTQIQQIPPQEPQPPINANNSNVLIVNVGGNVNQTIVNQKPPQRTLTKDQQLRLLNLLSSTRPAVQPDNVGQIRGRHEYHQRLSERRQICVSVLRL